VSETWSVLLKREMGSILKKWYLGVEKRQGSIDTPIEGFAVLLKLPNDTLLLKPLRSRRGDHHKFTIDPWRIDRDADGYYGMIHTHSIHVYGATVDDGGQVNGIFPWINPMSEIDRDNVLKREAVVEGVIFRSESEVKLQTFGHIYKGDPNRFSTVSLGEAPLPPWLRKMIGTKIGEGDE